MENEKDELKVIVKVAEEELEELVLQPNISSDDKLIQFEDFLDDFNKSLSNYLTGAFAKR